MRYLGLLVFGLAIAACTDSPNPPTATSDPLGTTAPAMSLAAAAPISNDLLKQLLLGPSGAGYGLTWDYQPVGIHAGIDLGNRAYGGPVYAPVSGQVIGNRACGKVIILDDFGNSTILLHMINIVAPAAGGRVRQGDKIGEVGKTVSGTCTATGPHLHVEVRKGKHEAAADPKANNTAGTFDPRVYFAGPAGYGSRFGGYSRLPGAMWPGAQYSVGVVMQNTGPTTWDPSQLFRLGSQNPQDNGTWGVGRVSLPSATTFGQVVDIRFSVRAPTIPGSYQFQWRMLREGVSWFGEYSGNRAIRVLQPIVGVSLMHGKCLDAPSAANGTRVHMWDCIGGNANQRWGYSSETGELKVHGEKCLDGWQGRLLDPVVVHDCHGGLNQQWSLTAAGNFQLRHYRDPSGRPLCLDIAQYARGNGAQMLLYTCHSGENQLWRQDPGAIGGSTVSIATELNRGMCMDAPAAVRGTELHLWDCLGPELANQRFRRTPARTLVVHGKCVDGHNGRLYDPVKLWDCHGRANQQWDLTPTGELKGVSNLCIDVRGASAARGTRMMLYHCHGGANQKWSYRDPGR